jgi:DNA primase
LGTFENELIIEKLKKRSSIGICFDNDEPGRTGARELKTLLEGKGIQNVNIVDLGDVCRLKGEDLADYFLKYQGDAKTLIKRAMGANV